MLIFYEFITQSLCLCRMTAYCCFGLFRSALMLIVAMSAFEYLLTEASETMLPVSRPRDVDPKMEFHAALKMK